MNLFQSSRRTIADAILDEVKKLPGGGCYLEAYVNGREQGYCLFNITHKVSFSQDRSCDNLVVYSGKHADFSGQGNVPYDGGAAVRAYYSDADVKAAAYDIHSWLMQGKQCSADPGENQTILHRDPDKRMTVNGWTTCLYSDTGHGWFWYGDNECRHNFRARTHGLHSVSPAIDELPVGVIHALQTFGVRIPAEYL